MSTPWSTDPIALFGERRVKVHEGRVREAELAITVGTLRRGRKAHESIGPSGLRFTPGTDLRREQSLGAAGHRDLLVLRARERDAINSMRAQAPKAYGSAGGKGSGG